MGWLPDRGITDRHFMQIDLKRIFANAFARRIAYVIVGLIFALLSDFARAENYEAQPRYLWTITGYQCQSYIYTELESCIVNARNSSQSDYLYEWRDWTQAMPPPYSSSTTIQRGFRVYTTYLQSGSRTTSNDTVVVDFRCPYGGTEVTSTGSPDYGMCINVPDCPPGQVRGSNGQCAVPPPEPCIAGCNGACGQVFSLTNITNVPRTACISDCRYTIKQGVTAQGSSGTVTWIDVGNNTGAQCTVTEPAPEEPAPSCPECDCIKQNKSWGTVNGAVVCVAKGTQGSQPVTVNPPPKTTTTTPAPTPENPNPEPVTETTEQPQVTIGGGSNNASSTGGDNPDVTQTTTNPDGSTISETMDQESYCAANPNAAICKAKRTCEEYPDSPMCKFECEKFPDLIACSEFGPVPEPEAISTIERNIGLITLPVLPESNACPAPDSISIGGRTISLSYQPFCDYASAFKPLVLVAAWLSAAFIVVGFRGNE
jgi:hypothetical protein